MKYKAVIFDLDNTLFESRRKKWDQHKHVAKNFYGLELEDEHIRPHWGKPIFELVENLYRQADKNENIIEKLYATRNDFPKEPYPMSISVVEAILESGGEVGILSASTSHFIKDDLDRHGFPTERFVIIQGADDTKVHKPDPRVFDPLISKLASMGIKKEEIVYIGDSLDDFISADGSGIDFIGLTQGLYTREDFETAGVKTILSSIAEVPDVVL